MLTHLHFDEIKTKNVANVLKNLNVSKALVVLEDGNVNAELSARNIAGVKTAKTNTINVYDVMKYNTVVATKAAVTSNRGGVRIMANVQYYDVILKPVVTEKTWSSWEIRNTHSLYTQKQQNLR